MRARASALSSEEGDTIRWHWSRPPFLPLSRSQSTMPIEREENGAVIDGGIRSHIEIAF